MAELTLARLKELLQYDPETGAWVRLIRRAGTPAGSVAGNPCGKGYLQVVINRKPYLAHRLAWFYVHGRWPQADIDHVDGNRSNNRLSNLREATRSQNIFAIKNRAPNKCGVRGVKQVNRRWRAEIRKDGRLIHLGYFDTKEAARVAYEAAAFAHFGEFARAA